MAAIDDLLAFSKKLRYEDLPQEVIDSAKKSILDTLATTVAGSSAEGCEQLISLVKAWGGREEARILVDGSRVPAFNAAFVNSTMARARDLDDVHELGGGHLSATAVPAAFVICEYSKGFKNRSTNGKSFISAIVLGSEINCRLRMAGNIQAGWVADTFAPIAVAFMGGKMLGFEDAKIRNSLGIAYAQCSGNGQANVDGALTVRLQQGLGARAGIMSLVLADEGFTGAKDILEGSYGLYPLYMHGEYTPKVLTGDLGKRFEGSHNSIKSYPSCKFTHAAIYSALEIAREHKITADNVDEVTISTSSYNRAVCGGETKISPQTIPEAQFSYYYTVATALLKGRIFIEDFTENALKHPEVLALARRIKVKVDPDKDKLGGLVSPTDIEIRTKDGKGYRKSMEFVKGHPKSPMSIGEVVQKFEECARFSIKPISRDNIKKVSYMVEHLEDLPDVTTILQYLT